MAANERRRQQKLAAKKSKQRKKLQTRSQQAQRLASLSGRMASASSGEVLLATFGFSPGEKSGMIAVTLVRQAPRGMVAFANFLVDTWCLGVKDCGGNLMPLGETEDIISNLRETLILEPIDAEDAHAILRGGIQYAESLGFPPSDDCRKLLPIWDGIPIGDLPAGVEFGCDGRPCYIVGPFDNSAKQRMIYSALDSSVGEGNYDFVTVQQQSLELAQYESSQR